LAQARAGALHYGKPMVGAREERAALSRALRRCARQVQVSQRRIARETGVHESTVSRWFDDRHPSLPDAWQLGVITKLCGRHLIDTVASVSIADGTRRPDQTRLWEVVQRLDQRQQDLLAEFLRQVLQQADR
jgi:hypothetical protein